MTSLERPGLAHWMWERGLKPRHAEGPLGLSRQSIRRYCLPFGHADRRVPTDDVLERIVAWTEGKVTAADFYPPHLRGEAESAPSDEDVQ